MLSRLLFAAACLAILFGGWLGRRDLPWAFEPPDPNPAWSARYLALAPLVAGTPRMFFAQEDSEAGNYRLFRAQFVLAPLVLDPTTVDKVSLRQLQNRPLLLDYQSPRELRNALRRLRKRAAAAGLELTAETVGRTAVARVRPRSRS